MRTTTTAALVAALSATTLTAGTLAPGAPAATAAPAPPAAPTSPSTSTGTGDSAAAGGPARGIYQVWGSTDLARQPYVRGGQITLEWSQLEPARGRFDWSRLASALATYKAMGKPATVQVNSTTTKPAWIWDSIASCGSTQGQQIPQYWDPAYLALNKQMVDALAAYLKSSPYRSSVALVRSAPNAIGTELTDVPAGATCRPARNGRLYSGAWSRAVGLDYYQKIMGVYRGALLPAIPVAHRVQLYTTHTPAPPLSWLGPQDAWIMGTASDIDSNPTRDAFDVFATNWSRPGKTQAYWEPHHTTGKKHLVSWNYWRLLLELHKGVNYVAVYGQEIAQGASNPEYRASFDFVNRYAGSSATPGSAPGAWVALKQGGGRTAGNLTRHMVQLNADATSTALDSAQGASPIGSAAQRYGRFARSVTGGTARSTMSFALDPAFRTGVAGRATTVRVVYLDRGTGSFALRWGTATSQSSVVRKTGSGTWRTATVSVPGSSYRGALPGGADVALTALGTDTTTAHMVEVQVPGR